MTTTKKRINITLPPAEERAISQLAKRDHVPEATKAAELLRLALTIEEDELWDRLASERDSRSSKFISHEKAWT